jgi:hypothetical protein
LIGLVLILLSIIDWLIVFDRFTATTATNIATVSTTLSLVTGQRCQCRRYGHRHYVHTI